MGRSGRRCFRSLSRLSRRCGRWSKYVIEISGEVCHCPGEDDEDAEDDIPPTEWRREAREPCKPFVRGRSLEESWAAGTPWRMRARKERACRSQVIVAGILLRIVHHRRDCSSRMRV